jgi:hypothetical protein
MALGIFMSLLKSAALGVSLFSTAPAWAACATNACDDVALQRIYVNTNGRTYIKIDADISHLNCTPAEGQILSLLRSDTNSDNIYAMLLTLQSSRQRLSRIRIVEGANGCNVAYVWQDQK